MSDPLEGDNENETISETPNTDFAAQAAHSAICEDSLEDCLDWRGRCVKAVEAAAPHIMRRAADYLEDRMSIDEPTSDAEAKYQAGYADAVARLILLAEGKAL